MGLYFNIVMAKTVASWHRIVTNKTDFTAYIKNFKRINYVLLYFMHNLRYTVEIMSISKSVSSEDFTSQFALYSLSI